ncbi:hypothetical protein PSTT_14617, partial [Puccinia striiformis]
GDSTPRVHSTQIQFGSPDGCLEQPLASFNRYQRRGLCTNCSRLRQWNWDTLQNAQHAVHVKFSLSRTKLNKRCHRKLVQSISFNSSPSLHLRATFASVVSAYPSNTATCVGRHFSSRDESCPPTYHPLPIIQLPVITNHCTSQTSQSNRPNSQKTRLVFRPSEFLRSTLLTQERIRLSNHLSNRLPTKQTRVTVRFVATMDQSGMAGMSGMAAGSTGSGMQMEEMSRPKSNHTGMGMMMNTFFVAGTPNVPLWFDGWQPSSTGATFGACFGLFVLTVAVKLLGALRHQAQIAWSMSRWHDSGLVAHNTVDKTDHASPTQTGSLRPTRPAVPWSAQRDVPRGILAALHVGLEYFLMLAIMTYNVYFFVAIVLGHFVGEMAFGRWSTVQGAHC